MKFGAISALAAAIATTPVAANAAQIVGLTTNFSGTVTSGWAGVDSIDLGITHSEDISGQNVNITLDLSHGIDFDGQYSTIGTMHFSFPDLIPSHPDLWTSIGLTSYGSDGQYNFTQNGNVINLTMGFCECHVVQSGASGSAYLTGILSNGQVESWNGTITYFYPAYGMPDQHYNFNVQYLSGSTTLTYAAVPEPATWAFMILGFGLVGGALRRRQRVAAWNTLQQQ